MDTNDELYFNMMLKLDLIKYKVNLIKLEEKIVKLINLIDWMIIKSLILYCNINFLLYLLNISAYNIKFFNLFIGFLAKLVAEINKEIMKLIL